MNVRRHVVRALLGAGLTLVPFTGVSETRTSSTATIDSKTTALPSKPYLRLVSKPVPGSLQNKGDTAVPAYPGGKIQRYWTARKKSPTASKTTTSSTTTTTRDSVSLKSGTYQVSSPAMQMGEPIPVEITIDVTILARQNTCSGGPQIPAKLSYSLGTESVEVPLFGGANVEPGMTTSFTVPAMDPRTIKFITTFQQTGGCIQRTRNSDDANQAFNIIQGTDLLGLIAEKNVNLNYDGQQSLISLLVPTYVDPVTGYGILPNHQSVIAFEYMPYGSGATFDMNDLVILVSGPPILLDAIMWDGIGLGTTATDNQPGLATHILPGQSTYAYAASEFVAMHNGTLSQLDLIGYQLGSNADWNQWDYIVNVWSSWEAASASRLVGDVASVFFYEPTLLQTFGIAPPGANGPNTYDLTFDLSSAGAPMISGENYIVGVGVYTAPGSAGYFRASSTLITGGGSTKMVTQQGLFDSTGSLAYRISETLSNNGQQQDIMNSSESAAMFQMLQKSTGEVQTD